MNAHFLACAGDCWVMEYAAFFDCELEKSKSKEESYHSIALKMGSLYEA